MCHWKVEFTARECNRYEIAFKGERVRPVFYELFHNNNHPFWGGFSVFWVHFLGTSNQDWHFPPHMFPTNTCSLLVTQGYPRKTFGLIQMNSLYVLNGQVDPPRWPNEEQLKGNLNGEWKKAIKAEHSNKQWLVFKCLNVSGAKGRRASFKQRIISTQLWHFKSFLDLPPERGDAALWRPLWRCQSSLAASDQTKSLL